MYVHALSHDITGFVFLLLAVKILWRFLFAEQHVAASRLYVHVHVCPKTLPLKIR